MNGKAMFDPKDSSINSSHLIQAYAQGIFPMAMESGEIGWFSPQRRGLLPLEPRKWPHGIRRDLKKHPWEIRTNTAFAEVMRQCAARPETWIDDRILRSYLELHRSGFAHSLEVWLDGRLVGGLYGVHLGAAFFGESMFHLVSGASKVALVVLIESLTKAGFMLLDTQWQTPHLKQFGGYEVSRGDYLKQLDAALRDFIPFPKMAKTLQIHTH